jgi:uncharacterized DUF497 family protein
MRIEDIIWLEQIVEKLWRKHSVETDEVSEVFANRPRVRFVEKGHRPGEDVYVAMGQTNAGRYLSVFFVYKSPRQALVLSARDMSSSERKKHEQS